MKKLGRKIATIIPLLLILILITGCSGSSPKTLENVASNDSNIKEEIDSFILHNDNLKGYDRISISGNDIYAEIYVDEDMYATMTDESTWDYLKDTLDNDVMGSQAENVSDFITKIEEETGVEGIHLITRLVRESNEETYYSYTFSKQ